MERSMRVVDSGSAVDRGDYRAPDQPPGPFPPRSLFLLGEPWVAEVTGEAEGAAAELRATVEAWIADDPDEGDRAELQALLDRPVPPGQGGGAMQEFRDRLPDPP